MSSRDNVRLPLKVSTAEVAGTVVDTLGDPVTDVGMYSTAVIFIYITVTPGGADTLVATVHDSADGTNFTSTSDTLDCEDDAGTHRIEVPQFAKYLRVSCVLTAVGGTGAYTYAIDVHLKS